MSRGKRWCFTLNNYTSQEYSHILERLPPLCNYVIVGKEGAEATPHLQGYFETTQRCRLPSLKGAVSPRAHFELARGTAEDNRRYCSKSDQSPFTHGEPHPYRSGQRQPRGNGRTRDELALAFRSACDTGDLQAFATDNPGCYYFSGSTLLRNYALLREPVARPEINVKWFHGPPGSNKSRDAHAELASAYCKDARTKWWNGYLYQRECIIDDFGPNSIDITRLLVWFDRYKCLVETKGGMMALNVIRFIVTSNFDPVSCFTDNLGVEHVQIPALLRRINVIQYPLE